jgi:acyl-CoA synthetase (AMP-forming)/AMP-acid ligase II
MVGMETIADPATARTPPAHAWHRPADAADPNGPSPRVGPDPAVGLLDRPIFESVALVARRQPDALAVQAGARRVTYGRLLAQATALAVRLTADTEHGAAVAILLPDPVDATCAILACLAAGRPCLSLNVALPPARLTEILADAAPGALVVAGDAAPCAVPLGIRMISLNGRQADTGESPPRQGAPDAPCLVTYTSGSTGRPKGIVRSAAQMLVRARKRIQNFQLGPSDRTLQLYSLSNGPGVSTLLSALLSGGALYFADPTLIGARGVLGLARMVGATQLVSGLAMLRVLFALSGAGAAFATLRGVYAGSDPVFLHDIENWRKAIPCRCVIHIGYGLTEGSPLAAWLVPPILPAGTMRLPVGRLVPWTEFAITGPDGSPVAGDDPGELWARGRMLSLGEWRQGRCVPGSLLTDPDDPAGAILRTGDLVRLRQDGLLEFLGRVDDQIRIRGYRVEPAEVERVLRQTPGVADAALLTRRGVGDPVLVAFAVAADDAVPATVVKAASDDLSAALPAYMRPARLHVVAFLPKLPSGKFDPAALARMDDALRLAAG